MVSKSQKEEKDLFLWGEEGCCSFHQLLLEIFFFFLSKMSPAFGRKSNANVSQRRALDQGSCLPLTAANCASERYCEPASDSWGQLIQHWHLAPCPSGHLLHQELVLRVAVWAEKENSLLLSPKTPLEVYPLASHSQHSLPHRDESVLLPARCAFILEAPRHKMVLE